MKQSLEEHRNQGHFPFHEGCLSRSAAKSFTCTGAANVERKTGITVIAARHGRPSLSVGFSYQPH